MKEILKRYEPDLVPKVLLFVLFIVLAGGMFLIKNTERALDFVGVLSVFLLTTAYAHIVYVSKKYCQAVCLNCGAQLWKRKKENKNRGRCPFCREKKVVIQKWQV